MSELINGGGDAFPHPVEFDPNGQLVSHGSFGMSLRDYFAGQAMTGMLSNSSCLAEQAWKSDKCLAEWCYKAADAMIAERNKGK